MNNMRHVIVYRKTNNLRDDEIEIEALQAAGFIYLDNRSKVQPNDLVIARYSCWPFYNEFVNEIEYLGGTAINTSLQHDYICDIQNWVMDLKELTPLTWKKIEDIPSDEEGPFVLKGGTNSRKGLWKSHMYAANRSEAIQVYFNLLNDSLIGLQPIYIRKFVPLYTYSLDVIGMPITKEFRFFICDGNIVCGAYYWSSHVEELTTIPSIAEVPEFFLKEAMTRIASSPNAPRAYTLDVGLKEDGQPIVIELNDLQMSGLSENSPFLFYKNLKRILEKNSN